MAPMHVQMLIRRLTPFLNWIAVATLIGALAGLFGALRLASENSYFQGAMRSLAGRVLEIGALDGARAGLLIAAGGLLVFALAWPVCRFILRSSRKATIGAVTAVPVLALLAVVAYKLNLEVFPSLLSAPSLLGNAALIFVAALLWWLTVRWFAGQRDWLGAIARHGLTTAVMGTLLVLAIGVPVGLAQFWRAEVDARKPNVLIVLIDALRADRLGSYGYHRATSPNLDQLARDGWRFTTAISQAAWTKPSVASLITGLYPRQTSVNSAAWAKQGREGAVLVETLTAEHLTLAEQLASSGYETAAFGHNHHLLTELGFSQGYLTYDWKQPAIGGPLRNVLRRLRTRDDVEWIHDHFINWVDANEGRKFFAYLHHLDVHWPYRSPAPFAGMFMTTPPPEDFNRQRFMSSTMDRLRQDPRATLNPETLRAMSDAYDEGIRHVDDGLGKLFDALVRRGLYDDTLIIITADHGEEFMDHGQIGHGETLYDEMIRVPLIVKFPCPGPHCGPRTVTSQVELVDIFPTVMRAVGMEPPGHLVGRNLSDPAAESRVAYSERAHNIALRTPEWKWIYDERDDSGELYNLAQDPGEANDLSAREPAVRELLSSRVLDFAATRQRSDAADANVIEADEKMLENLKALGYVQ